MAPDVTVQSRSPIVETASGRVSGVTSGGVHVFKGMPYGASTAGANRFLPPKKPEPWTGVLDLVAALEWVREHAARFGGDPGNVTIFGQSGGGGKVCALLAMPRAKGLFHKAIIQSGASVRFAENERTTRLADEVLKQLGLRPDQLDSLQALPLARLQEAVAPAQATLPRPRHPLLDRYNFGPVIDGSVLPAHPFDPAAPAISDDVPIMIGGTKDETAIFFAPDDAVWNRTITEDELKKRGAAVAGAPADSLLA